MFEPICVSSAQLVLCLLFFSSAMSPDLSMVVIRLNSSPIGRLRTGLDYIEASHLKQQHSITPQPYSPSSPSSQAADTPLDLCHLIFFLLCLCLFYYPCFLNQHSRRLPASRSSFRAATKQHMSIHPLPWPHTPISSTSSSSCKQHSSKMLSSC